MIIQIPQGGGQAGSPPSAPTCHVMNAHALLSWRCRHLEPAKPVLQLCRLLCNQHYRRNGQEHAYGQQGRTCTLLFACHHNLCLSRSPPLHLAGNAVMAQISHDLPIEVWGLHASRS